MKKRIRLPTRSGDLPDLFAPISPRLGASGATRPRFIAKLSDAEGEAAETQTWLEFSVRCEYLEITIGRELFKTYDEIISMLVTMINRPETWVLPSGRRT